MAWTLNPKPLYSTRIAGSWKHPWQSLGSALEIRTQRVHVPNNQAPLKGEMWGLGLGFRVLLLRLGLGLGFRWAPR